MIDGIVLALIAVAVVFGFIRGIVSQIMALAGIVLAYIFAPDIGHAMAGFVQKQLGSSRFMAEKASIFLVGVAIYVAARLAGVGIEKLVVNRVKEFKKMNRLGGAGLGALKMGLLIAIVFCFVTLLPPHYMGRWTPGLLESRSYRWAARYNPMVKPSMLEQMRALRAAMKDPARKKQLERDPKVKELLSKYKLDGTFQDQRFVRSLEDGDFDAIRKNEEIEKLMNDDQLVDLLGKLGDEKPSG